MKFPPLIVTFCILPKNVVGADGAFPPCLWSGKAGGSAGGPPPCGPCWSCFLRDMVRVKGKKRKGKKGKKDATREDGEANELQEDFAINVKDDRFKAVLDDHTFAIDPSNPQ